ncbi:MAG: hypothetical protein A3J58_01125 [Candidatus Sungbacteria bacterium RIFCSPHIGHO2_02_FULL_52_23]|uniref:Prepilin-type N-terminal cleavage/methylation domain-containing protein n=1 Tax=Candidatus Sungbacteria bacterium RIFCSPHIGHO2_02_FULL_52_23 TaxID=1802274 RepID=A0A1G2KXK4_9BACT|nr:MAG: hypothetical protein A3J58_01125 [Candidatus Sungbacteria bacterium RIFCSPHIGHO2_02_FULL_52_23]
MLRSKLGRNERGYTFVELLAVLVIMGVFMAASMTYLRASTYFTTAKLAQIAMVRIATEEPGGKYPAAVTITDLESHGASSLIADYTINSYARTGTPSGKDYQMELEAPDTTTLFCITEGTLTRAACP